MEIKVIDKNTEKQWEPVTLAVTLGTVEEARLLFHVLNREFLLNALKASNEGYGFLKYSEDIAVDFSGDGYRRLRQLIEAQGFEV